MALYFTIRVIEYDCEQHNLFCHAVGTTIDTGWPLAFIILRSLESEERIPRSDITELNLLPGATNENNSRFIRRLWRQNYQGAISCSWLLCVAGVVVVLC